MMTHAMVLLILAASGPAQLAPDARLVLTFPKLPNTLTGLSKGTTEVPTLSAILPSDYTPTRRHPVFIYLKGGSGSPYDGGAMAREIVGPGDFIAVQMPLFKASREQTDKTNARR